MEPAVALDIPLPPSPPLTPASIPLPETPHKPRLANHIGLGYRDALPPRRPAGWRPSISPAPRNISASSVLDDPRRTSSSGPERTQGKGRVASASVLSVGGRVVSGTMQYALMPLSGGDELPGDQTQGLHGPVLELPSPPPTAALAAAVDGQQRTLDEKDDEDVSVSGSVEELDLAAYDEALGSAHAEDAPWATDRGYQASLEGDVELELYDEDDAESADDGVNIYQEAYATNQDQDEIWMSYVRQQLNTLFPDFFADTAAMTARGTVPGGMPTPPLSSRQPSGATQDAASPGDDDGDGEEEGDVSLVTSVSSAGPPTPPDRRLSLGPYGMAVGNVRVPNVRNEISDLREEIGRLRGVVDELADGSTRGSIQEATTIPRLPSLPGMRDSHNVTGSAGSNCDVPKSFLDNASKIADIIRLLDRAATTEASARDGRDAQSDEAVFEYDNLSRLERWVRTMCVSDEGV